MANTNTLIGYIWGGERQTADHRPIAMVTRRLATDVAVRPQLERMQEFIEARILHIQKFPTLDAYARHGVYPQNGLRHLPVNTTVLEWNVAPEWWEIIYTDANGDSHQISKED